jgi:translation initiation factor 2 subunit 2
MEDNYENLLSEAYDKVKPIKHTERFEIPKIEGHLQGNKTVLTNLQQITTQLRRPPEHLLKFLLKELATAGTFKENRTILQTKNPSKKVNEKIQDYANEFVICKECKKPDTELIKEHKFMFLHCLACGAKYSVRARI